MAAISKACARRASPISARSRSDYRSPKTPLLVALPQAPETRRPDRFPNAARSAARQGSRPGLCRGVISAAERDVAKQEPVPHGRTPSRISRRMRPKRRCARQGARQHRLTLDAAWQASLERLAHEARSGSGRNSSAAILVVDNASGEIRAHVGGADYFSAARAGAIDMTQTLRSPARH